MTSESPQRFSRDGPQGGTPASRLTQRSVPTSIAAVSESGSRREGSAGTQATNLFTRDDFQPADDSMVQNHLEHLKDYLKNTNLEEKFSTLCHLLLNSSRLPYNPYPGFLRRLSHENERFYMFDIKWNNSSSNIGLGSSASSPAIQKCNIQFLVSNQKNPIVYGLRSLVSVVDPDHLRQYQWLLEDVTPAQRTLDNKNGYGISAVAALCGPDIFYGTFNFLPSRIKIRIEYFVRGKDINKGITVYAESIAKDIWMAHSEGPHILLGINIPVLERTLQIAWSEELWTVKRMQNYSDEFLAAVITCTKAKKSPVAEFAFKMDPYTHMYRRGEKQYVLNFIEEEQSREGTPGPVDSHDRLTSYTSLPMLALHDGIFMNHTKAEFYMTSHIPALAGLEGDWDHPDLRASLQSVRRSQKDVSKPRRGWRAIFDTAKSKKVTTEGIKEKQSEDEKKLGPYGWQFVAPISCFWEKKIASMHSVAEAIDSVYYILLLTLIESDGYPSKELHSEASHLMHSTAVKLHALMDTNKAIVDLMKCFQGYVEVTVVDSMFMKYKNDVISLLAGNELQERSSAMHSASMKLTAWLDGVTYMDKRQILKVSLKPKSIEIMQMVNHYCLPLLLMLTEDALQWCPEIKKFIASMKEKYGEEACIEKAAREPTDTEAEQYVHGSEIGEITQHDQSVIDVETVSQGSIAPTAIAADVVLLKYVSDIHLDETWQQFLLDLLSGGTIPPNPYPRLLTALTQAANRLDVQYMSPLRVTEEVYHGSELADEADSYIFTIPGSQIYGTEGCLAILDWECFPQVIPVAQEIFMQNYPSKKGPYRLAVCPAISGDTLLYGKISPYLHSVCLLEYCFVRGPRRASRKGLEWYTDIVYQHLAELSGANSMVVYGVYMGTAPRDTRWTLEAALNKRRQFDIDFIRHLAAKEPVYLKVYVPLEWRYIPVIKHFMLHYISEDEKEYEVYYPHTPLDIHQSVFLDKEKANFYYERCDPVSDENPYSPGNLIQAVGYIDHRIIQAKKEADWIGVQKWILQRSLVAKKSDQLSESWYLFHSIAGRLEYIHTLIKSLIDLVTCVLEKDKSPSLVSRQVDRSRATLSSQVQGPVDHSVLSRMVTAFRQKFHQVVTTRCALAAASLPDYSLLKLDKCMELDVDTASNLWVPIFHQEVISIYEEVSRHIQYLQDSAAFSMYQSNQHGQEVIRSIERKEEQRPESVYSEDIAIDSEYFMKPAANVDSATNKFLKSTSSVDSVTHQREQKMRPAAFHVRSPDW